VRLAVRHGALSTARGVVSISWTVEGDDVVLVWREIDGPPVE